MNSFVYHIPTKVYFGENQLCHLGEELKRYGTRVLLAYGGGSIKKMGLYDNIMAAMEANGLELFELSGIEPNPRIQSVRAGADLCKEHNIDVVLAVGGGSTIDAAKYIAAGAKVDFDPWDFFTKDVVATDALPLVTILTLSATGSEMDAVAVVSNMETNEKLAGFSPVIRPAVSFLDPTNTYTVSAYQTACGSADILSHIMEVYFTMNHDLYMLDTVIEGLMKTVIKFAPIAMETPDNYEARANLMWASSWGINGFLVGGKDHPWSCHPMEHELSAFYDVTHGLGLAILTPHWMEHCLSDATVSRFVSFGVNVFGIDSTMEPMDIAKESIARLRTFFFDTLKLDSTLTAIGIPDTMIDTMAEKACGGDVIDGFVPLHREDIAAIYRSAL